MKTSRPEISRASRASLTAAELIRSKSSSRNWRGELAPVGAEGVRLDQVGARVDEADVERDDGLRRAQVRLLGGAQARARRRDQRAHAAVGHDRRPVGEPAQERLGHAATLDTGDRTPLRWDGLLRACLDRGSESSRAVNLGKGIGQAASPAEDATYKRGPDAAGAAPERTGNRPRCGGGRPRQRVRRAKAGPGAGPALRIAGAAVAALRSLRGGSCPRSPRCGRRLAQESVQEPPSDG